MNKGTQVGLGIGVAIVGAFVLWKVFKGGLSAVGTAVNPLSDQNLAYQGVSALTQSLTGDNTSFGGWLYDSTHSGQASVDNGSNAVITGQDGARYAPTIYTVDANGNLTSPVSLSQASNSVLSGKYSWGMNPALGYYDRIIPVT